MSERVVRRPDAPQHHMFLQAAPARAYLGENLVAETSDALVVTEVGRSPYPPVAYFPREAMRADLNPVQGATRCPLKGTASYFDLQLEGTTVERAVWSYEVVMEFDPELEELRNRVAFDPAHIRVEIDASDA